MVTNMGYKGAIVVGILLEILLGAAAAAFYFMYYIHTPTYSINALHKAIQSGDVEEFQHYVDLDAVLMKAAIDLDELTPQGNTMKAKLRDGSFVNVCKEDILNCIANGDWKEVKEITEEIDFQNKIGLRTMSIRRIEYVAKDVVPEADEEEGEETSAAATEAPEYPTASVGVRIYEPNLGDTFVIHLKMRQLADESWQVYDVLNYGEFVDALMKQNERDLKRYVDKVRTNIRNTEDKFADLKRRMPVINKEWIIEAQKIMKESCEDLDSLKVPLTGARLDSLLRDRRAIFYDMMDMYYESLNYKEKVEDYKKAAEEAAKAAKEKGKKLKQKRPPNFDKKAAEIDGKLTEINKKWENNKTEIDKIIGPKIQPMPEVKGLAALRNNDDDAVRRANYPGADRAAEGDGVNPLRAETLPEVSAMEGAKP